LIQKNKIKILVKLFIVMSVIAFGVYSPLCYVIEKAQAEQSILKGWVYSGWRYRKAINITLNQSNLGFYDISDPWTTIIGNPTNRHAFQPVHTTTIVELNITIDGANRRYLAYDSDAVGSEIRLYYADSLDGQWMPYSGNPILGPRLYYFRWPSVTYVNGIFHMFLTNRAAGTIERWTSTDGIHYSFVENVQIGTKGESTKNPFIWLNPNDNKWYLYWHDAIGLTRYIYVRNAVNIEDLDSASDTTVLSQNFPFGAPSVMYFDGNYWLLGEVQLNRVWRIIAYYSATSPSSGFIEASNSPILSNDEACPMIFLDPTQTRAYLFSNKGSSSWYQETREVYINKEPNVQISEVHVADYQVRFTVHYASGVDNGENVYLNGHSRSDFGDVRFAWFNMSSNQEIECNYWIEDLQTSDYVIFWVKIPEISSASNNIIRIYYGKDNTVTTSNGDATFDFFDDFSGTLNKWTVVGGTWKIENGELSAETTATPWGQRIRANGFTFGNHSVHVKIKWISGTYFEHGPYVRGQQPNEPDNGYMTFLSTWGGDSRDRISKMSNGLETTIAGQGTTNPSKNVWYTFVFKLYGNKLKSSIAPLYPIEITATDNTFSSGTLCLFSWSATAEHAHYDDIFVCKYVYPEPSHGTWGNEEEAGAPPTPSISVSDMSINTTIAAKPCNFSAVFTAQNSNLSHYIFGTNNTGAWINDTAVSFGEGKTQALASIIKALNSTIGTVIQWQIWANNTAGNWTTTGIQSFTTSGNQSTIATLTTYGYAAVEYACQRKTFYANGRFWVFYFNGTLYTPPVYSSSTDGVSWTSPLTLTSQHCTAGWTFSIAFDGTYLHYVFSIETQGNPLYYRKGIPNANGTITWLTAEQNITVAESNTRHLWPSIAIDSEGRPWIAYARLNSTEKSRYAYVTTTSTSNGTWITRAGFPHQLSSTNYTGINVMILPLTNQKMLAIISCGGWQIESYLWNGSSWSEKQTTTSAITSDGIIECGLSAVNQGDDVHLVFIKDSTHDLVYTKYSYASNSWGPETIVQPTVNSETSPVLSIDSATNMLYCFWAGAPTADCIYYKVYNGAAWSFVEGSNPWIIERNLAGYYRYDGLSGFYKSYNNLLGLAYTNGAYGIYQLKFAFLTTKVRQYVIIDQALVSDERANVGSVQTVMFHAKWSNGSDVVHGSIYINGTEYITDNMGWITFEVTLTQIGKDEWGVTAVSCSGVTDYMQSAPNPSIIWDKIIITYSANPANPTVGQTVNFTISAVYGYNGEGVNFSYINTYRNNTHYASGNSFTDIQYSEVAYLYTVENVSDNLYGLTAFTSNTITVQWVSPPPKEYVIIDAASVSDNRADVSSLQTVAFHAKLGINGSDIVNGNIYVNGTMFTTNSTGWVSLNVASSSIGRQEWVVTAVNCEGVTDYTQIVSNPSIIWDQIQITSGGTTKESIMLGETATIWFQAKFQYDDTIFDNTKGILCVNDLPMSWSATNSRWEYQYTPTTPGTKTFTISSIQDNSYGLTTLNDMAGAQTIIVWSTPFLIISSSNITEVAFNSTTKTITFTVTGPTGTTGYTNITIAKTLIENITDLTIYLDDHEIEYLATSTEYTWLVHFNYTHSTHKVTIQLSQPNVIKSSNPQPETTTLLGGILIGILTATPLIRKKVRRKTR